MLLSSRSESVLDGVQTYGTPLDAAFTQTTNLIINTAERDPGLVNLSGTTAADFDLAAGSPAIDAGTLVSENALDFLNRAVPDPGGATDVGAFEYGSTQGTGGGAVVPSVGGATTASGGSGGVAAGGGGVATGSGGVGVGSGGVPAGSGGVPASGGGVLMGAAPGGDPAAESEDDGGCSCRTGSTNPSERAATVALLLVLAGLMARRRRGAAVTTTQGRRARPRRTRAAL